MSLWRITDNTLWVSVFYVLNEKTELFMAVSTMQWMEVGLGGVPGPAVINNVAVAAQYAHAPAPVLLPRTVAGNVKERRTRSNHATPNPVVRQANSLEIHTNISQSAGGFV